MSTKSIKSSAGANANSNRLYALASERAAANDHEGEQAYLKQARYWAKRAEVLARESAMRSLGLAKVRGSLGGTYWE